MMVSGDTTPVVLPPRVAPVTLSIILTLNGLVALTGRGF